jgi:hypothetical protein
MLEFPLLSASCDGGLSVGGNCQKTGLGAMAKMFLGEHLMKIVPTAFWRDFNPDFFKISSDRRQKSGIFFDAFRVE